MLRLNTRLVFQVLVLSFGGYEQASALGGNDKSSFAQMEQALVKDHQVEIARSKYVANVDSPALAKVLCMKFTINAAGDGYILLSDDMDDTKAQKEMVYGKVRHAHAYDPLNIGVLPKGVSAESRFGQLIKKAALEGDSLFFRGESVKTADDGSESIVGFTTAMVHLPVPGAERNGKDYSIAILLTTVDDQNIRLDKAVGIQLKTTN